MQSKILPQLVVYTLLALVCWVATSVAARASDAPPLILNHLTPAEGLPQGTVMATLQDSQGFVWFATQDGLVRYDGIELVRYAYTRNTPKSLPGNFIYQMTEDTHHDLWVAVKDVALARWNRASNDFTVFRHDPTDPTSLSSNAVRALAVDAEGQVWVGTTDAGIDILDPATGRAQHRHHVPGAIGSLSNDQVFNIFRDAKGSMWIATAGGLDHWLPQQHSFAHSTHIEGDPASLSGQQVSQFAEDADGTRWVGTYDGGLNHLDAQGHVLKVYRHDPKAPGTLAADDVRALLINREGQVWVGTSEGLDLLDRDSDKFLHYHHEDSDAGSLRDSYIWSLYEDDAGLIWIGTNAGGVSRWNPRSWQLGGHRPPWLSSKLVTAFADAGQHRVWIGSLGGGLMRFDDDSGQAIDFDTVSGRRNAIGDSRVMALLSDRSGTLWIGTMTAGLQKYTESGALTALSVKRGDPRSLSAAGIMTLYQSLSGEVWVGTHGGGVDVIDPASGSVRQLPFSAAPVTPAGSLSNPNVSAIAEDSRGHMWFGTDGGGLDLADIDGTVRHVFRNDPADDRSLPSNTVYSVGFDNAGVMWVATDRGVARMEGMLAYPETVQFVTLGRDDGLTSDAVYSMLNDGTGHLWMSGNAGLMRYDPVSRTLKTFHREHGLQGEEFDMNAYHRLNDGRLCFGGPGGFNIFDPTKLTNNTTAPRLAMTRLEVLGAPLPSATPYWLLQHVDLDASASIVSLDFSALDFTSPQRNRLAYRVTGLSERWIELGAQHRITLTNLDAGDHVLEVRAANADSVWSDPPLRLTLHRAPPLWRSWWACALYAAVLVFFIGWRMHTVRERFASVERAKKRLETEVALATRELLESNRQLEEASQAKSNFLARMSHELRTPMNGVVGSAELLARTGLSAAQLRMTETIRASSKVLLQIVNDLLDLSKAQAGKLTVETTPVDLLEALEESAMLFAAAAQEKGVELIIDPPPRTSAPLLGDPLRLRQILMNLIGNALKFTATGEVVVRADLGEPKDGRLQLSLSVADTGIGMDAATIAIVFEPFTQADESTTRRFGGTGLGLAICRELAERLGGTIRVDSKPQVGSVFHVELPLSLASAAPAPAAAVDWQGAALNIVTRRASLQDALVRHARALGLSIAGREASLRPTRVIDVIDASMFNARAAAAGACILLASDGELKRLHAAYDLHNVTVVHKPLQRAALRAAVAAVLGIPLTRRIESGTAVTTVKLHGHVLLVDDESVNAAIAQGYLAELGCSSVWVDNGAEAVTRSGTERFDLIMMDLNMPTMDGLAATRLIRATTGAQRAIPIVALTAHDAASYRAACLEAGMNDIMSKPYTFEQCANLLRGLLPSVTAILPVLNPAEWLALAEIDLGTVAALRNLSGVGPGDLYMTLTTLFESSSAESLTGLQAACASNDVKALGAVCHRLAAAAANVGALAFAREARHIEQLCAAQDLAQATERSANLLAAHPLLLENMAQVKLQASA